MLKTARMSFKRKKAEKLYLFKLKKSQKVEKKHKSSKTITLQIKKVLE